jgi:WD40 repeat protein
MDGSIILIGWGTACGLMANLLIPSTDLKRAKYIKAMAWCPTAPILAAASADGVVGLMNVSNLQDDGTITVERMEQLNLNGTVESLCFTEDGSKLICYTRGTPFLSYFDLEDNMKHTKINLNSSGVGTAAFQDHVSFAVMDMAVSPNGGKFLALATDTSRNIVIDIVTGKQLRNLYGHKNDGYSIPKICWSCNGQYIMGNTQEDGSICVWDVASAEIVKKLDPPHAMPVRDLFSSKLGDTLVTTAFDKQTKLWMTPLE